MNINMLMKYMLYYVIIIRSLNSKYAPHQIIKENNDPFSVSPTQIFTEYNQAHKEKSIHLYVLVKQRNMEIKENAIFNF